jgi:catechol 2,3-dioxygenase-like lactoylglutathione lyase family enzyme
MRLNQITLQMQDFDRSVKFWLDFGLIQIVSSPPRYARFECPAGDGGEPATLSLELGGGGPGAAVYFEVEDLGAEVARLRQAGILVSDPVDQTWLWREAHTNDPAGNPVVIYAAGVNRRFPPWRMG